MAWEWGEQVEEEGSAEAAASKAADRFNKGFPENFAARVRDLHRSGKRDPRPGAVDHWVE